MEKYLWFKIEFYDKNTLKIRHRTVKVKVSKYTDKNILERKLEKLGFRNIEILEYYIVNTNYLRSPLKTKTYEYVAICLKCANKNIVQTNKPKSRLPKTIYAQCNKCKTTTEQTIIGKVLKTYKRWNTVKIKWFKPRKSKIPNIKYPKIAYPSVFEKSFGVSTYNNNIIRLYYHEYLNNEDLALKLVVFDVNHEFMHYLLEKWISEYVSVKYDLNDISVNTEILYLQIGTKNKTLELMQKHFPKLYNYYLTIKNHTHKPINTITIN